MLFLLRLVVLFLFLPTENTKISDDWFARKYYVRPKRFAKDGF